MSTNRSVAYILEYKQVYDFYKYTNRFIDSISLETTV